MMPLLLAVASWSVLLLALLALWCSLACLLLGRHRSAPVVPLEAQRATLLEEKRALLASIKDLEFDRDLGKLDAQDFAQVDADLRRRAQAVLQQLDEDVAPYRQQAAARVAAHLEALAQETK